MLVALNLYTKLSFGRFDKGNALIIEVAQRIGAHPKQPRDEAEQFCIARSLSHGARSQRSPQRQQLDREMWAQFRDQRNELAPESEAIFRSLYTTQETDAVEVVYGKGVIVTHEQPPLGPTEILAPAKIRRGQQFFRQAVLNRCGITGIGIRSWLVASQIEPWSKNESERLNPSNGLCLSRLHDAAFDQGLTTFDEDYCLIVGKAVRDHFDTAALRIHFEPYEGKRLDFSEVLPPPSAELLARHRERFAD